MIAAILHPSIGAFLFFLVSFGLLRTDSKRAAVVEDQATRAARTSAQRDEVNESRPKVMKKKVIDIESGRQGNPRQETDHAKGDDHSAVVASPVRRQGKPRQDTVHAKGDDRSVTVAKPARRECSRDCKCCRGGEKVNPFRCIGQTLDYASVWFLLYRLVRRR